MIIENNRTFAIKNNTLDGAFHAIDIIFTFWA